MVSPKRPYTLKIDEELLVALRYIKERDGISESEQIRRGVRLWLAQKRVTVQSVKIKKGRVKS
jgi:hypothetical protein